MRSKSHSVCVFLLVFLIGLLPMAAVASGQTPRKVTKLGEGIFEIEHEDTGIGFSSGNTTVIIGERQVLVVDSGFLPSAAQEDIAQIRQWTNKPVSFLLTTHFHNDHNLANRTYMDVYPTLTILAHVETKREMDLFGPGSAMREENENANLKKMLETGKTGGNHTLTPEEVQDVKDALVSRLPVVEVLKKMQFQSATLTFEHDLTVDLGNREVQVKFLGKGNTAGDTVAYLPKEKIVIVGDLVVYPIPYIYDGYPTEWIQTLQNLSHLDAGTLVPGHGPVMRDKVHLFLIRDLLKSAVEQMNEKLRQSRPAMFQTLDEVKGAINLEPFRSRFVGAKKELDPAFDEMTAHLVKVVFEEASLR